MAVYYLSVSSVDSNRPVSNAASVLRDDSGTLRKRWIYLLPAVFITYSLAYVDRANFGFGAAAGMAATLHMTGRQISLLSSLFFLGYFVFQLPGASVAKRVGIRSLIFVLLILWGAFAALTGVLHTFWMLAVDRVLLGIAESLIMPAMLVLITRWFTRAERARANTILILGNPITVLWMSVVTGYLVEGFGWQKTFIIEGVPSILWAAAWFFLIRDKPTEALWLEPAAAVGLEARIAGEQANHDSAMSLRAALLRGDVLLLTAVYFFWCVGVYGFVLWLPLIVQKGGALSMGKTGVFSSLPYAAAIVMMLVAASISDRTQRRASIVWPFLLLAGIALAGSFVFAEGHFVVAYLFLIAGGGCMYAPYGPFFAIIPERIPRVVAPEVIALINSAGALGAFLGSYFVGLLQSITGRSQAGFLLMSMSLTASAGLMYLLPASSVGAAYTGESASAPG